MGRGMSMGQQKDKDAVRKDRIYAASSLLVMFCFLNLAGRKQGHLEYIWVKRFQDFQNYNIFYYLKVKYSDPHSTTVPTFNTGYSRRLHSQAYWTCTVLKTVSVRPHWGIIVTIIMRCYCEEQYGGALKNYRATTWPCNPTPRYISREKDEPKGYMHPNVHCGTVYTSQDMEQPKRPCVFHFNKWTTKHYIYLKCTGVEKISKTSYLKKKRKFQNNMYIYFF